MVMNRREYFCEGCCTFITQLWYPDDFRKPTHCHNCGSDKLIHGNNFFDLCLKLEKKYGQEGLKQLHLASKLRERHD